jgi:hypothetical protein
MKFFFPDSQDQIDPGFDFGTEEHPVLRVRQRDDLYAHEALNGHVIDGLLVSKAIVDGTAGGAGKYTVAQRNRLYRAGVRHFFRLDQAPGPAVQTMGDCGAFSYIREDIPPVTPDQVIDFYAECGFDLGISVDHVIFGFDPAADTDPDHAQVEQWRSRQEITLDLAGAFLARCKARRTRFEPLGVAQGWSPASYAAAVRTLQEIGYTRIALGGMVPLKTGEILACLGELNTIRDPRTQFHLLGITRRSNILQFASYGVTSFDSTSAFRQAFKDDKDNYHTVDRTYTAIRVPQVDGYPRLKAQILAGQVDQDAAIERERACLRALQEYDAGETSVRQVIDALQRYNEILGFEDYAGAYKEVLDEAPWKTCSCNICAKAGINVLLFRGSERNKRRGFHNLNVFRQRLDRELDARSAV